MYDKSPLGKTTVYVENYSPDLLFPISRTLARKKIGLGPELPFTGVDIWNGYELSWLNEKGKPQIAMAKFVFPHDSAHVIESKSFKLYLNSFNQSRFSSWEDVESVLSKDLSQAAGSPVDVSLISAADLKALPLEEFHGICLDDLDIETDVYEPDLSFLKIKPVVAEELVYSHLLKSNCLATGQPDWGSVAIKYKGPQMDHEGLLKYLISLRRHSGFAEHCVEHIYHDLMQHCKPQKLTVYARYTRRGGLDINPFRSNFEVACPNIRLNRQ